MSKVVEVRWTCCNQLVIREEKQSVTSKFFRRSGKASSKEPIVVYQNGRCPECTSKAIELGQAERRAREDSEAECHAKMERMNRMPSTATGTLAWESAAGPAPKRFSFGGEELEK